MSTTPAANFTQIRPGQISGKNEISFLWRPGVVLVDLVYDPGTGKLRFVTKDSAGARISDTASLKWFENGVQLKPLEWLQRAAHRGAIGFPSQPVAYENVDMLAEAIRGFVHRYFDCDEQFEHVATAYVLMTWVYEKFDALPYLRFLGEPESGKSTGNLVVGAVCYRKFGTGGSQTPAPLYRMIEALGGTLLMDEADFRESQIGSDVAKILNSGYRKGFPIARCNEASYEVEFYDAFGPKIFNGRKPFKDEAVETRCLTYRPITTTRGDIPLQLPPAFDTDALDLRNRALSWRLDNLERVTIINARVDGLGARATQISLPLLTVVAEINDNELRERYRKHVIKFALESKEDRVSAKQESTEAALVQAYVDITGRGAVPTCQAVADAVLDDDESPFAMTARTAGWKLRGLGFKTKHGRSGSVVSIDPPRLKALKVSYGIADVVKEPVT